MERERMSDQKAFEEETTSELSPRLPASPLAHDVKDDEDSLTHSSLHGVQEGEGSGMALGIVGLVLSLASLFTLPFFLSLIGIGAGFAASRRGARSLGKWAIGVGIISMIGAVLFAPLVS